MELLKPNFCCLDRFFEYLKRIIKIDFYKQLFQNFIVLQIIQNFFSKIKLFAIYVFIYF